MLEIARQFVSYRSENLHTSIHPISCELVETADIASLLDIAALQTDWAKSSTCIETFFIA